MPEQFIVLAKDSLRPGAAVSFRSTPLPFAGRIRRLVVKHDANAAGASTFDVNLGGATIFAAPGDRPSVAAGETEAVIGNLSVAHAENAVLSLDADAVPLGGLTNVSVIVVSDDQLGDKPVPVEFFIRAMYLGVLGREPLSAELTSTEATLGAACLGLTFEAAAAAFATDLFTGAAFLALATTDEEFVTALYRGYFNREPDAGGLAHWTGEVGSTSREIVRAAFAADIGFRNRLPLFCRNAKPVADAGSIAGMSAAQFVYETVVAALVDSDDIGFEGAEGEHQAFLTETGVVAGEYGDATHIPVVTVDAKGRVTEITEVAVEGGGEGGAGDATSIWERPVQDISLEGTFEDDFDDNTFDAIKWDRSSAAVVTESSGRINWSTGESNWISLSAAKNFTNKFFQVRANPAAGNGLWIRVFMDRFNQSDNWVEIRAQPGSNLMVVRHAGSDSTLFTTAWNGTNHKWFKISHDGTVFRFSYAPDVSGVPGTWVEMTTATPPASPATSLVRIYCLQNAGVGGAWIDSFTSDFPATENLASGAALVYNATTQQFEALGISQVVVVTADPSGAPTGLIPGHTAVRFNVTNNKLWVWNTSSSAWKSSTFS